VSQHDFLKQWAAEQFPAASAPGIADVMTRYYALNFIRKPEFMGFNGYNDGINRTSFNPLAWGNPSLGAEANHGQNTARSAAWSQVREAEASIAKTIPAPYADAFFELVAYPIEGSAAMNDKLLATDLTYLDAHNHDEAALKSDTVRAHAAYDTIQSLTAKYNGIEAGKWSGIMSSAPRERHVFEMSATATLTDADKPLPASWAAGQPLSPPIRPGFVEQDATVSINAAHFTRKSDGSLAHWNILPDLGISGASVEYGDPGLLANTFPSKNPDTPYLEYDFTTISSSAATLTLHLLPTFAVDSDRHLRYAVSIDGHPTLELDASGLSGHGPDTATWSANVLRNSAVATMNIASLTPGAHTIRLMYRDPGVVFEHLVLTFPGAPPAYPIPPETTISGH
jgi:hypothetical protein